MEEKKVDVKEQKNLKAFIDFSQTNDDYMFDGF